MIILFCVFRLLTLYRYQFYRSSASSEQWARRYMWLTLAVGLMWASMSSFVYFYDDVWLRSMVFIIVVGATSMSVPVFSSVLMAFYVYITPMSLALVVAFLSLGSSAALFTALAVFLFWGMNLLTARRTHQFMHSSLLLRFKNQSLIDALHQENIDRKQAQEALKVHGEKLESLVDERTKQLVLINHSLEAEIGERRRAEDDLKHLAHHDALTGLPNRLLFKARLEHAIERVHRTSNQVAVLFLDLDKFKNINDSLGHAAGDDLLRKVAKILTDRVREDDTVARLGGDEFVVVMEQVKRVKDIERLADKLMNAFEQSFDLNDHTVFIGSSIGISVYPRDGDNPEQLISNADAAMYQAKAKGRRNYQFYTENMTNSAYDRVVMESSLRRALEVGELFLLYQPQIDLGSGEMTGVEALVRWQHPQLGILEPDIFVPLAEETGLIVPIGHWVMRAACRQMAEWKKAGTPLQRMAINLAGRQCNAADLAEVVEATLVAEGCQPQWLELEITERFIMSESSAFIDTLDHLKGMGIHIAIDDFGTGYSSLSYLKRLPVDKLKIDKSFIDDLPRDKNDEAIVRAIIAMGKALQLIVTAEGIDSIHLSKKRKRHLLVN